MEFYRFYSIWILFTCILMGLGQPPTTLPRQYLVRRDFFNVEKASEFSVFDETEKQLYYRIESNFHLLQRVEVIRYPEKKKTGRLGSKFHFLTYRGEFSILNERTNEWINGEIERNFKWTYTFFVIRWNGHEINMTNTRGNPLHQFRDEQNEVLAEYTLRTWSVLWRRKYDVKIFSNKYPDELYLLALAAHDRTTSAS